MAPTSSKRKGTSKNSSGRPLKVRKVKEVVWDDEARKDYLTGFSKRKKQRAQAARDRALQREKEEKREARNAVREERKQRAAENVKQAKALYGDAGSGSDAGSENQDGSGDDSDDEEGPDAAEYNADDLVTTVTVEPFSISRSPSPVPVERDAVGTRSETKVAKSSSKPTASSGGGGGGGGAASGGKRRVKTGAQMKPKMTKDQKKERATMSKKRKARLAGKK